MRPSRSRSCSRSWSRGCCSSAYPFWKDFSDGLIESRRKTTGFSRGEEVKDLYLDDAGRPHVIELNPQSNSGLYALDMDVLLTAIRDNPEQFMPDPSRGGMPGCLGVREETCI